MSPPATVRNEMADLERRDTLSNRIHRPDAYRRIWDTVSNVDELMNSYSVSPTEIDQFVSTLTLRMGELDRADRRGWAYGQ